MTRLSLRPLWDIASAAAGVPVEVKWDTSGAFIELGWGGRASVHPTRAGAYLIELCPSFVDQAAGVVKSGFASAFWHEVGHVKMGHLKAEHQPGARMGTAEALSMKRHGHHVPTSHDANQPGHVENDANAFAAKMIDAGYGSAWLLAQMKR